MAESFARKTGAPIVDKPGEYLTIHFDSKGVSLSGFGLTYQGDFAETMMHRVTNGRLQHEMLVKVQAPRKKGGKQLMPLQVWERMLFYWLHRGMR